MSKELFLASEFVATKFSSTAEKAEFGNALLKFLDADCAPGLFTNRLYQRLSMTFGHIAHYNSAGGPQPELPFAVSVAPRGRATRRGIDCA